MRLVTVATLRLRPRNMVEEYHTSLQTVAIRVRQHRCDTKACIFSAEISVIERRVKSP